MEGKPSLPASVAGEFDIKTYKYPGQYVHTDGILYGPPFKPAIIDGIKDFEFDHGDVVIASYPKSGTTWLQEIVHLLKTGKDPEEARRTDIGERVRYLELPPTMGRLRSEAGPRLGFTHLRPQHLQKPIEAGKLKVILVVRNPKDTLTSYFHFHKKVAPLAFHGGWDDYWQMVSGENRLLYGGVVEWVADWCRFKDSQNVLLVKYEDLKADRSAGIARIAKFLDVPLSEEALNRIVDATGFDAMKRGMTEGAASSGDGKKPISSAAMFMRKGQVGDWRNHFSDAQAKYLDDQVTELLVPKGFTFSE